MRTIPHEPSVWLAQTWYRTWSMMLDRIAAESLIWCGCPLAVPVSYALARPGELFCPDCAGILDLAPETDHCDRCGIESVDGLRIGRYSSPRLRMVLWLCDGCWRREIGQELG